jgi:hypothetical protein
MHTFCVYKAMDLNFGTTFRIGSDTLGCCLILVLLNRRNTVSTFRSSRSLCAALVFTGLIFLSSACLLAFSSSNYRAQYAAVVLSTGYIIALSGTFGYMCCPCSTNTAKLESQRLEFSIAVFCVVGWGFQFIYGAYLFQMK